MGLPVNGSKPVYELMGLVLCLRKARQENSCNISQHLLETQTLELCTFISITKQTMLCCLRFMAALLREVCLLFIICLSAKTHSVVCKPGKFLEKYHLSKYQKCMSS